MGLFDSLFGGGGTTQTSQSTSTATRTPWQPAADLLTSQVMPLASQFGASPLQYTGASYIPRTPGQESALAGSLGYFGGAGQSIVDPTMQAWQASLDPAAFMNAPGAMNPLTNYAYEVGRALDENIRPGYARGAIGAGQYGGYSSERAQQERLAERDASEAIARYGGNLFGDLYGMGLQMRHNAVSQAPGMMGLGATPYQNLYALSGMDRAEAQRQQDLANARTEFGQMEPYTRASLLGQLLHPMAQLGGTVEGERSGTTTTERNVSPFGALAGLGMTAAGLMGPGGFGLLGAGGLGAGGLGAGTAASSAMSGLGMLPVVGAPMMNPVYPPSRWGLGGY